MSGRYVADERNELPAEARVAEISRNVQREAGRRGGGAARVMLTPAPTFVSKTQGAARLFEQNSIGKVETASATQYSEAGVPGPQVHSSFIPPRLRKPRLDSSVTKVPSCCVPGTLRSNSHKYTVSKAPLWQPMSDDRIEHRVYTSV